MLKIYRSKFYMSLSVPLTIGGNKVCAEFKGGSVNPRICGCYVTMDGEVQQALESEPGFNRDYVLERMVDEGRTSVERVEPGTDGRSRKKEEIPEVTKVQEAAEYLCEHYGAERTVVNTKAKIRAFVADKEVVFPNLNLGDGKE